MTRPLLVLHTPATGQQGLGLTPDWCEERIPIRQSWGRSVHGTTPWISIRTEHLGSCRFKKSLYGLRQALQAWNTKITQRLRRMGFAPSKSDSSLFIWPSQTGPISILLYVNDLIITGADLGEIIRIKSHLAASFDMKDLGDLHYFLGIEVIHTPEGILISQRHYALSMLFKFGMADCKPISTPLDRNVKLRQNLGKACDATQFWQIVGSLIYLMITRSDLSYPVSLISQFMSQPTSKHL